MAEAARTTIRKTTLAAIQPASVTITCGGETLTIHPGMTLPEFRTARRQVEAWLLGVAIARAQNSVFVSDDAIADATEVYGDHEFAEVDTPCSVARGGQCEFNALVDPDTCIHCGRAC